MEESVASTAPDAELIGIEFGLASNHEIRTASISDCPISHASQLANPFLGLPLEMGKCESCGTAEPGKCEGHFGYIELPIPIYHPSHVRELQRLLSLVCLKCLKFKSNKIPVKSNGVMEKLLSACCDEACVVTIKERTNNDGASFLELRIPSRSSVQDGCWNFLERYGYRYGEGSARPLLPSEVLVMLKKLPEDTRKKLAKKGYIPQDGYILRYIPVPPNCLSVPDISDGISVMSSDLSSAMLKKVLRQIEVIRGSRSGEPNFESHEVEANDLQVAVLQYLQVRGTSRAARAGDSRYGVAKEGSNTSSKAWVDKMRTLFISKGSGFSSRSVITGDAFRSVNEVGVPCEIAQKMTFEERVNVHNIQHLQSLVDKNQCLTFKDGLSTYSLREGSKGHTFLKLGQVVHRRIMDGDVVFINRPPTTHKHSLQALRVYIHDDHVVKINPLMCSPLSADFDGDCVHLFYPQSLSARAEVLELFSVEKQLLSSHNGNLNLQLTTDSLLSLKALFKLYFLDKASAQQLAMHSSTHLPYPALLKACSSGSCWTAEQILQTALPPDFECQGDKLIIRCGEVVKLDYNRDVMASIMSDILNTMFFNKSPKDALDIFDSLQPLLMENLFSEGFSVGLDDFFYPISDLKDMQIDIQDLSSLLFQLRSSFNELVQLQFEAHIKQLKLPIASFILKSSALGNLIDSRSDSAINKIVEQIGFLGLQLSDKRKFYSRGLVEEVATLFRQKYPFVSKYPSEEFGFVTNCFFHGLDPYEEIVHAIATREVIVRSSKGLAEPGTLFKNLMAILRDVVVCYDGTVRNISSNSIIQFEYGVGGMPSQILFAPGEPVGVLAATAMSNPAYKAVLDSSPNSNSSWDMMKEILFCRTNFRNDLNDRRVILYLKDCCCGRKYCQENASCLVKNHLKKVSLRDAAVELSIEYKRPKFEPESCEIDTGLVGHIHLNAVLLKESGIGVNDILLKCEEQVNLLRKKKKHGYFFKRILLSVSECCFFKHSGSRWTDMPCLKFFWQEQDLSDSHLERTKHIMADMICPALLDTIIKGDPRISTVNIIWINPGTTTWVQSPCSDGKGELAVEVTLEKEAVRHNGDAWRIVLDCCLPVFHLIDSTRSIPYAIKQIEDLFGVSSAFDQAIQRLSTSVAKVTKDVLKEHLLLLASSMTCSGNLVGFNMGGIKALCRALNVKVPFTEATLYTPRKCFERASEKRHMDTLASIVGSCSWGKRVALGTGAKFDVLWDTEEIGMTDKPIDVYNFLHLVSCSNEEEMDTGCLGEDIENFDSEDVYKEHDRSPEQENKAVFEDIVDTCEDSEILGTAGGSSWDASLSAGNGWNTNKTATGSGSEEGGWSAWGSKQDQPKPEDSSTAGGWGAKKEWNTNKSDMGSGLEQDGGWSSWGSNKAQSKPENSSKGSVSDAGKEWTANKIDMGPGLTEDGGWSSWGSKKDQSQPEASTKAGTIDASKTWSESILGKPSPAWGPPVKDGGWSSLGSKKAESQSEDSKAGAKDAGKEWITNKKNGGSGSAEDGGWSSWGSKKAVSQPEASFKSGGKDASKSWGESKPGNPSPAWGPVKGLVNSEGGGGGWLSGGVKKNLPQPDDTSKANQWGAAKSWGGSNATEPASSWGKPAQESSPVQNSENLEGPNSWNDKVQPASSKGWDSSKFNEQGGTKNWESKKIENNTQSTWAQQGGSTWKNSEEVNGSTGGWGSGKTSGEDSSQSWNSRKKENRSQSSWGQQNNGGGSSGSWGLDKANKDGVSSSQGTQKMDKKPQSSSWGTQKEENKQQSSWGQKNNDGGGSGSWGSDKTNKDGVSSSWGTQKTDKKPQSSSWGAQKEENNQQSSWGQPKDSSGSDGGWSSKKGFGESHKKEDKTELSTPNNSSASAGGWNVGKAHGDVASNSWGSQKQDKSQPSWGQSDNKNEDAGSAGEVGGSGGWDSFKGKKTESSWGQPKKTEEDKASEEDSNNGWDSKKGERKTQSSWGQSNNEDSSGPDKSQSPWGQPGGSGWNKRRAEGGGGWGSSNSGEWKSRRNRPPKLPGGPTDDSSGGPFTANGKPMDIFSAEEQDVLAEVESIMLSMRRIMHQSGLNDGDHLPAEDQTYVIENVLNHHPDKAAKIGGGVDFITVKKHSKFGNRCFYVVSTDGQDTDFSYIKCLQHFVKGKYPSVAESFSQKYFRKPRSEGNPAPPSPAPPSPAPPSPSPAS